MILRAVWGMEYAEGTHVLRTYVNQLRTKLRDDPFHSRFIRTESGIGYRFLEPDAMS
jgi:two-component system, OmpR family, KDP operon response regulator KdpE